MNLISRLSTTAAKASLWMATRPFAGSLMMLALPVTFAVATALIIKQPPCGSGAGGGGPC